MEAIRPATLLDFTSNVALEHDLWEKDLAVVAEQKYIYDNAVWEVLTPHTTDTAPIKEDSRWLRTGPTNQYAMFDKEVNTRTISTSGTIQLSIQAGRVDSLALLGLKATHVAVELVIEGQTEFQASANLVTRKSTGTWLGFFTEPFYQQEFYIVQGMVDTALIDLPRYLNATLNITITNTGGAAECGMCRAGLLLEIGDTDNDAETGIEDYSLREINTFGQLSQQERAFAKEISTEVFIDTDRIDFIYGWLTKLKDEPLVWIGIKHHSAYIVYGYGKWRITRKGAILSKMSIDVEGLI